MTVEDDILSIVFQNFDVVTFEDDTKAICIDGRFYFQIGWRYALQENLARIELCQVKAIFRPDHYNGDALRFLDSDHDHPHNMRIIYKAPKTCPKCGTILPEE